MWTKIGVVYLAAITLVSCSGLPSNPEINRKIENDLKAEPAKANVAAETKELILEAPNINEDQKQKLLSLQQKVNTELSSLRTEEGKLRVLLVKTLVDPKTDEREIANIKARIIKVDKQKIDRMLSALSDARKILGRRDLQHERVYRAFLNDRPSLVAPE